MLEGIIKVIHRLALELAITKRSGICTKKNNQAMKKGVASKSLGEESCEIKGGGQQMAAVMLILIKFNNGRVDC